MEDHDTIARDEVKQDIKKDDSAELVSLTRRNLLRGAAVAGAAVALPASSLIPGQADARRGRPARPGREGATYISRDEDRYSALTQGFNRRFDGNPVQIAYVRSAREIETILEAAARKGKGVTIRSGGHCYEGWCVTPRIEGREIDTLIDMSLMTEIFKEKRDRRLRGSVAVGTGSELWSVYREMYQAYGATPPGGSCYSVGAGGHMSGGGYGVMSRLQGMVVDHIVGLEIVVLDENGRAKTLLVTDQDTGPEGELFWAVCGGGGGNFGVVTRFYLRPLEAMNAVQITTFTLDPAATVDQVADTIKCYGHFWETHNNPDPTDPMNHIFALMPVAIKLQGKGSTKITVQWSVEKEEDLGPVGTDDAFSHYMKACLADHGVPLVGKNNAPEVIRYGWLEAAQQLNGSGPNQRGKYKSAYMKQNFTDTEAHKIAEFAANHNNTFDGNSGVIQVDSFGGMVNAAPQDFRAYPHRSSCMALQWQFYWNRSPSDLVDQNVPNERDEKIIGWANRGYEEIYGPNGPLDSEHYEGCYINYPDNWLPKDKYGELYYLGNYPRLREAKGHWDPLNFFQFSQSIQPATGLP